MRRETVSAHDRRRYFVECMEQYIVFLHEQLKLVGHEPAPLENVAKYKGMSSRSVRVSRRCLLTPSDCSRYR